MEYKSRHVDVQTDSKNVIVDTKPVLLCQKQSTKEIVRMLASINIVPICKNRLESGAGRCGEGT